MRPTVILLDVDGTLLSTGGAGRRAMGGAFVAAYGRDPCDFSFAGMTDRAIVREGLSRAGAKVVEGDIDRLIAAYLALLADEVLRVEVRLCPGIDGALAALEAARHVALGLGTGNVRAGAALKVGRVIPFSRFSFGGYGCDHEDRAELLRKGAERGADKLGLPLEACRIVVVGDTPRDVAAAKALGAESFAVATGGHTLEALAACTPTFAFADLAAPGAMSALLGGG